MSLTALYHKERPMIVVKDEEVERLVTSGKWFKHPNDIKQIEVSEHEEPIRQRTGKRRSNAKHSSKTI